MNQILRSKKVKTGIIAAVLTIVIVLIVMSLSFAIANESNNKILKRVYINNIYVGNMTKEEAKQVIEEKLSELREHSININVSGYTLSVYGKSLDIDLESVEDRLREAYEYGRDDNILINNYTIIFSNFKDKQLLTELTINDEKFEDIINKLYENVSTLAYDDTYTIDDTKIEITRGREGIKLKTEELRNAIIEAFKKELQNIEVPTEKAISKKVDIDELYDTTHIEPKDAVFSTGTQFEVIQEMYGRKFNKEDAKNKYLTLKDGEKMEIAFETLEPKIKIADLNDKLFKDVLGIYKTNYDQGYTSRVTNLKLAASKINGTIVYPGEEFSYNKTVGERTMAEGFKEAHVFAGGKVVDGLGGGICQISTTLYNSVLLSNLEVVERKNHMMHTGYQPPGRDATVVYGNIDFRFKNNREMPIKIEMTVQGGTVTAKIYGIKNTNDPIVEIETVILKTIPYTTVTQDDPTMEVGKSIVIQNPINGYVSETYKILKTSSGEGISRTLISKDSYLQTSKIVKVGTKVVEVPVEPVIPEEPELPTNPPEEATTPPEQIIPPGWDNPENPYVNNSI